LIEAGAPLFEVRTYQTLGLDAPPTDLHVLPDGRLVLFAGQQIAIGDGVRWERFQQAADDPLTPAQTIAIDHDGLIYMGVAGGFARVEFGRDARWSLHLVAPWTSEDPTHLPVLKFAVQIGDDWFWHGDSGPLVAWRPGQTARVVGRADTTEQVLHLREAFFLSDRTTGGLWRIEKNGGFEPVVYSPDFTSRDTLSCGIQFGGDQLLVGTFGRGLKLFDGRTTWAKAPTSTLSVRSRMVCMRLRWKATAWFFSTGRDRPSRYSITGSTISLTTSGCSRSPVEPWSGCFPRELSGWNSLRACPTMNHWLRPA
jgi:hypothetical protein